MAVKINDVTMPMPALNGIAIADEPIWSSKTGRNTSGKMIGDIVGWKTTIAITWPPLSFSDVALIRDTIKNAGPFFTLEYYDTSASQTVTKTVYSGNIPRTLYSLTAGHRLHSGITIQFIER